MLQALRFSSTKAAADGLAGIRGAHYRPFNLVMIDRHSAFWLRNAVCDGPGDVELFDLPPGLSMFTAHDRNDPESPRLRKYLPLFRAAPVPEPDRKDWSGWIRLLASLESLPGHGPEEAMTVRTEYGFGTLSSSLIALPRDSSRSQVWRFAGRECDELQFEPVSTGLTTRPA